MEKKGIITDKMQKNKAIIARNTALYLHKLRVGYSQINREIAKLQQEFIRHKTTPEKSYDSNPNAQIIFDRLSELDRENQRQDYPDQRPARRWEREREREWERGR
ncbi:MAG: hypothetical protein FWH14_00355 [Oscillospiraceae bacterium]|nr:hypothetical protein [Oscillospiraceae bacterium]